MPPVPFLLMEVSDSSFFFQMNVIHCSVVFHTFYVSMNYLSHGNSVTFCLKQMYGQTLKIYKYRGLL